MFGAPEMCVVVNIPWLESGEVVRTEITGKEMTVWGGPVVHPLRQMTLPYSIVLVALRMSESHIYQVTELSRSSARTHTRFSQVCCSSGFPSSSSQGAGR